MKTLDWLAHQDGLAFVPQVRHESALTSDESSYTFNFAASAGEVYEAQRLRFKVFAEEMGASLPNPESGLDVDAFDAHCEHLRVGAKVGGAPAWDPDFNSADLFMLLNPAQMNARYARHFT